MTDKRKAIYILVVLLFTLLALTFRPGIWLMHKPANDKNAYYTKGWEEGCLSGSNSYSLLYAPLLTKPFIKEIDIVPAREDKENGSTAKENYRAGWNEGFTLCRYYQSAVYELIQFAIAIATLLFIGYLLSKKKL